jgi:hypothetical protein
MRSRQTVPLIGFVSRVQCVVGIRSGGWMNGRVGDWVSGVQVLGAVDGGAACGCDGPATSDDELPANAHWLPWPS